MKTLVRAVAVLVLIALAAFAIFVASRQHLHFDTPEPAITASSDSTVIVRGRHIVRDVAMCGQCHGAPAARAAFAAGDDVPLSGGREWNIPPGRFYARNLTPDSETGIGGISDGAIARALRLGVGHDGRALLPFMEMQGLSDEDLTAVISYLRTQPAVHNLVPNNQYNLLGMVVRATILAKPVGPESPPPHLSPHGPTLENGHYIAGSLANCWACHTQRDERTGALTNALYSGAKDVTDEYDPKRTWAPPNLTSAPKTGRLAHYTEDAFVARFRAGRAIPGSPMPWQGFARMSDDDLRAIYRFLKSLPPIENDVGPPFADRR